jgi:hypothetical protein
MTDDHRPMINDKFLRICHLSLVNDHLSFFTLIMFLISINDDRRKGFAGVLPVTGFYSSMAGWGAHNGAYCGRRLPARKNEKLAGIEQHDSAVPAMIRRSIAENYVE